MGRGAMGTEGTRKSGATGGQKLGDICGEERGEGGREVRSSNHLGKENGDCPCIRIKAKESQPSPTLLSKTSSVPITQELMSNLLSQLFYFQPFSSFPVM